MSTIDNTGRQFLPVQHEYDFSGTTVNGPAFQVSFDSGGCCSSVATNFNFSVGGVPVPGVTGSFDWYVNALDVGNGSTIFRGEIDDIIPNRPGNGPDIGDLFYQGNLYTLATLSVTDPPVTSVPEPWGWIGVLLFAITLWSAIQFAPKGPGDMP